ncbi:hypothetical protein QJS04_geneDACA001982 [Acorus gramineus]|uniref:Uncharacterized protein n=1 Tax=Acorus gramineus TaxID=55184 RepID=A0AAV9AAJ7_ACOGR|nr:hypothetical protein QJS04_geneDACA001982 [Acorus gramineus]
MGYIGLHGVQALHRYRYSGVDKSLVAKYVLQPFWSRCVTLFPLWMPPNMVRPFSMQLFHILILVYLLLVQSENVLLFNLYPDYTDWVPVLTRISPTWICIFSLHLNSSLQVYSPHLDTAPPRWVHLAHALLLFLYQTFDAVDGKQARRTNSSSPLGELFDHGCDALACAFETLAFGSTAMSGKTTFWIWVISAIPFYCATWEHFFTNSLILPVINGPTEGLMMIYMFHFFTFFVGAEWWAQDFRISFPFLSWVPLLSHIPALSVLIIAKLYCSIYNVYKVVQARNGNMLLALAMGFYNFPILYNYMRRCYLSPSDIMRNYPHLLIVGTGFAFGYLVGRMILAHLCDEPKGLKTGMCLVRNSYYVFLNNLFFSYESALCVYQFHSTCILPHQWFMKLPLLSASTVSVRTECI